MFKLATALALFSAVVIFQLTQAAPIDQAVFENKAAPLGYIVKFKPDANVTVARRSKWLKSVYGKAGLVMSAATEDSLKLKWSPEVFNGFALKMNPAAAAALKANADVEYIEPVTETHAYKLKQRSNAPWGLARISHRKALEDTDPTSRNFTYIFDDTAGEGVDIYVLDTGVRTTHKEFGDRATWGATFIGTKDVDKHGHGTHCAGTVAGRTVGVARNARIIAVKVLGDDGKGNSAITISGINFAVESALKSGRPSVISMSLGGSVSQAKDDAVRDALKRGVHVVVAAGNDGFDASQQSPARVREAITVGASDINDAMADFSNFGDLVDVLAPGVNVISASHKSDDGYSTKSGTSMATPHVSGLVAYLIALNGQMRPPAMQARIKSLSTTGLLSGLPPKTVNALAYNGNRAPVNFRKADNATEAP